MNKSINSDNVKRTSHVRWALIIALLALVLAALALFVKPSAQLGTGEIIKQDGLLARIEKSGELHAGYGVVPPYSQEDPNTKAVSGFTVELIEQIAKELKCKVVWHRINWNTMSADLKRGEFDVIAEPILQTIPRAREFAFTDPYAYLPDGIAVVKKAETRFAQFTDLDRADITISVGQGWASEMLVRSRFTKAKIVSVQITSDLLQVFNDVIAGRADVAVVDGADAERFVKEHPDQVKALWLENPPAAMPAGFALRATDAEGARFLEISLRYLKATGVVDALAKKYGVTTLKNPQH